EAIEIIKASVTWAKQIWSTHNKVFDRSHDIAPRNCSLVNWIYMHTDGAVNLSTSYVSAREVIQNHQGNWILSFNHSLGVCSFFDGEL
ncbi:hypothetical protein Golax_000757, partial [Gossypium laxum]|nr:hypothetical protein [Gossypium laxum]